MLRRLPLRLRVTAAFALVTAVVLAATGLFLYSRLGRDLDRTLDSGLRARVGDIRALAREADGHITQGGRSLLIKKGERLAQILDPSGRVLDATPEVTFPLLDGDELQRARRRRFFLERGRLPVIREPARLFAAPIAPHGRHLIVVVGTSLEARRDAQRDLGEL